MAAPNDANAPADTASLPFSGIGAWTAVAVALAVYAGFHWLAGFSHANAWLIALTIVVATELGIMDEREQDLRRQVDNLRRQVLVQGELLRLLSGPLRTERGATTAEPASDISARTSPKS